MRLKKSKVGTSASLSAGLFALAASFSALAQVEFAPAVSYPIPITGDGGTGDIIRSLAAGDWDGDGDRRLADAAEAGQGGHPGVGSRRQGMNWPRDQGRDMTA